MDQETHRIIGGVIVGPHAGDMIGQICLAMEMGADAIDISKTIHPHPTFGETIGLAAEVYEGVCTDVVAGCEEVDQAREPLEIQNLSRHQVSRCRPFIWGPNMAEDFRREVKVPSSVQEEEFAAACRYVVLERRPDLAASIAIADSQLRIE